MQPSPCHICVATKKRWFTGVNPGSLVKVPEISRQEAHTLTLAQVKDVLAVVRYPEKQMALIAILTDMNVEEICGLQWKYVNLSGKWRQTEGEQIPPRTVAVRQQWCLGRLARVSRKSRNRNLAISDPLLSILHELSGRSKFTGPDEFVLVSHGGTPVNQKNIVVRRLKPIGRALKMPWLSWHVFRRAHKTLLSELGVQLQDRVATELYSCACPDYGKRLRGALLVIA